MSLKVPIFVVLLPFFPHLSSPISALSDYSPARKLIKNKRLYSKKCL